MYSIVVVNYGTPELVVSLLDSVRRYANIQYLEKVVVVDNGFPEKGTARDAIDPNSYPFLVEFIPNRGHSYSSAVNLGFLHTTSPVVVFVNSDVEFMEGNDPVQLAQFLMHQPDVGLVGAQQVYPDRTWQRSFGAIPSIRQALGSMFFIDSLQDRLRWFLFRYWRPDRPFVLNRYTYLDGGLMAVKREAFESIGGFDEGFSFYAEDVDFCYRLSQNGWRTVILPSVHVVHLRGASSGRSLESRLRMIDANVLFLEKHRGSEYKRRYLLLLSLSFGIRACFLRLLGFHRGCRQKAKDNEALSYGVRKMLYSQPSRRSLGGRR